MILKYDNSIKNFILYEYSFSRSFKNQLPYTVVTFQRDNVVRAFRERKIWVLICTELMARGIDFKGVNLVINYDFPPSAISYIHRVGRTGRAQHQGKAVTFWTMEDKPYLRR